jgi:hypothetical protein
VRLDFSFFPLIPRVCCKNSAPFLRLVNSRVRPVAITRG